MKISSPILKVFFYLALILICLGCSKIEKSPDDQKGSSVNKEANHREHDNHSEHKDHKGHEEHESHEEHEEHDDHDDDKEHNDHQEK